MVSVIPPDFSDIESRLAEVNETLAQRHECVRKGLRLRVSANGSQHIVWQCLDCGEQRGGAVRRHAAVAELGGEAPLPFDESLSDDSRARARRLWEEHHLLTRARDALLFPSLSQARSSGLDGEAEKRRLQELAVASCLDGLIGEVGKDQAFELLSKHICERRRVVWEQGLAMPGRFQDELELKAWLVPFLSEDFELHEEVGGVHLAHRTGVQIDYIAIAKPHLLAAGFTNLPFGIEVKYLNPAQGFSRKAARGFWQTISYTDCVFALAKQETPLKFAVMFSNLSFEAERGLLKQYGDARENDFVAWRTLLQLANHAGVGVIDLAGTREQPEGWALRFSGGTYFVRRSGRSPEYSLSNMNMIDKVRVGNF